MTGASQQSDSTRPKRTRARTFVPLGIAAWLVLEIWLLSLVAEAAGGFTVFLLLIAGAVVGAAVIKRAGRRAWQNLTRTMQQGAEPAEQPGRAGNSFTMLGGLLLMIPGLMSDVAALLCLFPPTASLLRRRVEVTLSRRMGYTPGSLGGQFRQGGGPGREPGPGSAEGRGDGQVIQGEVVRDDVNPDDTARGDAGRGDVVRDDKD
ncbi:FxsA family membrane protein [Streptomyces sp. NPDC005962]|uniref:FxsA family membrane protein n=1 Tax=Streptomyces sp. NPDC005962 TaxID=3154466 RepID=UPI0033DEEFDC